MPNVKLLAEKYTEVFNSTAEQLIENITPAQLVECFSALSRTDEHSVLVSFEHAIKARERGISMIQESVKFEDQDLRLAILALEKVLAHYDNTQDEKYCVMFENFISGKSLNEAATVPQKQGFMSKLGQGIKKYAGKAVTAIGNGLKAAPGAIAKGAADTGKYVGQTVGGAVGGLAGGLVGGAKNAYANARNTAPYAGGTQGSGAKTAAAAANATAPAAAPVAANTAPAAAKTAPAAAKTAPVAANTAPVAANTAPGKLPTGQITAAVKALNARDAQSVLKTLQARLAQLGVKPDQAAAPTPQDTTQTKDQADRYDAKQPDEAPEGQSAVDERKHNIIKEYYIINNKHFRK